MPTTVMKQQHAARSRRAAPRAGRGRTSPRCGARPCRRSRSMRSGKSSASSQPRNSVTQPAQQHDREQRGQRGHAPAGRQEAERHALAAHVRARRLVEHAADRDRVAVHASPRGAGAPSRTPRPRRPSTLPSTSAEPNTATTSPATRLARPARRRRRTRAPGRRRRSSTTMEVPCPRVAAVDDHGLALPVLRVVHRQAVPAHLDHALGARRSAAPPRPVLSPAPERSIWMPAGPTRTRRTTPPAVAAASASAGARPSGERERAPAHAPRRADATTPALRSPGRRHGAPPAPRRPSRGRIHHSRAAQTAAAAQTVSAMPGSASTAPSARVSGARRSPTACEQAPAVRQAHRGGAERVQHEEPGAQQPVRQPGRESVSSSASAPGLERPQRDGRDAGGRAPPRSPSPAPRSQRRRARDGSTWSRMRSVSAGRRRQRAARARARRRRAGTSASSAAHSAAAREVRAERRGLPGRQLAVEEVLDAEVLRGSAS